MEAIVLEKSATHWDRRARSSLKRFEVQKKSPPIADFVIPSASLKLVLKPCQRLRALKAAFIVSRSELRCPAQQSETGLIAHLSCRREADRDRFPTSSAPLGF